MNFGDVVALLVTSPVVPASRIETAFCFAVALDVATLAIDVFDALLITTFVGFAGGVQAVPTRATLVISHPFVALFGVGDPFAALFGVGHPFFAFGLPLDGFAAGFAVAEVTATGLTPAEVFGAGGFGATGGRGAAVGGATALAVLGADFDALAHGAALGDFATGFVVNGSFVADLVPLGGFPTGGDGFGFVPTLGVPLARHIALLIARPVVPTLRIETAFCFAVTLDVAAFVIDVFDALLITVFVGFAGAMKL